MSFSPPSPHLPLSPSPPLPLSGAERFNLFAVFWIGSNRWVGFGT